MPNTTKTNFFLLNILKIARVSTIFSNGETQLLEFLAVNACKTQPLLTVNYRLCSWRDSKLAPVRWGFFPIYHIHYISHAHNDGMIPFLSQSSSNKNVHMEVLGRCVYVWILYLRELKPLHVAEGTYTAMEPKLTWKLAFIAEKSTRWETGHLKNFPKNLLFSLFW